MSAPTPTELLAAARSLIEADPDSLGFIDRFTVVNRTYAPDGSGGTTVTESTAGSDIPGKYNERIYSSAQVAGGPIASVTLKIYLIRTAATEAITSDDKLIAEANEDHPERTFENLIRLDSTFSPVIRLATILTL